MTVVESGVRSRDVPMASLEIDGAVVEIPVQWLLACSTEPFDVDPSSRQRVCDPLDVSPDLRVVRHWTLDGEVRVEFSDGHTRRFVVTELMRRMTLSDPEAPPPPEPWVSLEEMSSIDWADVVSGNAERLRGALGAFHRFGCFAVRRAPTEPGSLHDIAARFGRLSATNFGAIFDVESQPQPIDLAYSAAGLTAHTDQPYRTPTPGLQFLHTLHNEAPGGESTVTDGLAGTIALRKADPEGYGALCDLDVEFRYDIGSDVVVNQAPVIELDRHGALRQLRFSPRLDTPPMASPHVLAPWFRARRWLAEWFAEPTHRIEFKMVAGDVLVVDNHRVLHGRQPFDPAGGRRHLQGCYIDHDGPATMWRMLTRQPVDLGPDT